MNDVEDFSEFFDHLNDIVGKGVFSGAYTASSEDFKENKVVTPQEKECPCNKDADKLY